MFLGLTMSRISTSPQTAILQWYCLRLCQPWSQPPVFIHCRQGSDNHVYVSQISRTVARVSEQFPPTPSLHLVSNMRGRPERWLSQSNHLPCTSGNLRVIPRTHGEERDWLLKLFWIPHVPWHTCTYSQAHLSFTHNTVVGIRKQKKCRASTFCGKDMLALLNLPTWVVGMGDGLGRTNQVHSLFACSSQAVSSSMLSSKTRCLAGFG